MAISTAGLSQHDERRSTPGANVLFFAGGHGWHTERNQAEATRLATVLGYDEGVTLSDPDMTGRRGDTRCAVEFSDGRVEMMTAMAAHKVAARPEVVSIVSEWQRERAGQLLTLLDGHYRQTGKKIDVIANSASALPVVLALRDAVEREEADGTVSPFGNVVLAYPAGLIKKASRFEDQRRVMNRAKEAAKRRLDSKESLQLHDTARRKFGRESVLAVARTARMLARRAKTSTQQMMATGGLKEQASAAVSLHTDILRQLTEAGVPVSLVLGDKDVMFPAERVLESLSGDVGTVLITDTNHGWSKPGRSEAVEKQYATLTGRDGKNPGTNRLLVAEGISTTRKNELTAALGRRAI